ncbi:MAG: pyridoxamine 5'-phosphate oxidase [Dehalococcoidia bacterium]|nr:pyridoxamine 5'-phosphate oxidase [Dehalococcoidia bacterium]
MQPGVTPRADRPQMPGYGISDQPPDTDLRPWSGAAEQLANSRNYWITSTRPDGRPHAIPVWGIWMDDALYFSTARGSRKGRNLAARPNVVAHLESGDRVVILEGEVEEEEERTVLERYVDAYDVKYAFRPEMGKPEEVVYRLRPSKALTWNESSDNPGEDFTNSATRWRF